MDRGINSWTPPEIAERAMDQGLQEFSADELKEARDDIIERLVSGKNFHGLNARDIFDAAIQKDGYQGYYGILDLLEGLLALHENFGMGFTPAARKLAERAAGFVEAYVDGKPEWHTERAEEIAADRHEDRLEGIE